MNNSTFTTKDMSSGPVKDNSSLYNNLSLLDFIKNEVAVFQNNEENNQSFYTEK